MLYNILYAYADEKDGKLILRVRIPKNIFAYIEEINHYLSEFGRYRVDCVWLAHCKQLAYDFKTTISYKKYVEKNLNSE